MKQRFTEEELYTIRLVAQSISDLRPNCEWELPSHDYHSLIWLSTDVEPPTEEEIVNQMAVNQKLYEEKQWLRDRISNYPPISEQLDMMYHANFLPKELHDLIKGIKEKYPKPISTTVDL